MSSINNTTDNDVMDDDGSPVEIPVTIHKVNTVSTAPLTTTTSNKKKKEYKNKKFVVLVVCLEKETSTSNNLQIERRWNEFSLPLDEYKVKKWSKLPLYLDLNYYHVPTFNNCVKEGINFVNYQKHIIDDSKKLTANELIEGECYFIFNDDKYQIDKKLDPELKKEFETKEKETKMLTKFRSITGVDQQTALFFLESTCFSLELALKNYYNPEFQVMTGGTLNKKKKTLEKELLTSAKKGDHIKLESLLDLKGDTLNLKCINNVGMTALHLSAKYGHKKCLKRLIQNDITNTLLNVKDNFGNTALHYACMGDDTKVFEYLLDLDEIDLFTKNNRKENLFHAVCEGKGDCQIFETLIVTCALKTGNDDLCKDFCNAKNNDNESPFLVACRVGQKDIVTIIVETYREIFEINEKNKLGQDAVIIAAKHGQDAILDILLNLSDDEMSDDDVFDVNVIDNKHLSPLHYAIYTNRVSTVKKLIDFGANPDTKDSKDGTTLLFRALLSLENNDIVKSLLKKCNPDIPVGDSKITALQVACAHGNDAVIEALINAGANVNLNSEEYCRDKQGGFFPLMNSLFGGNILVTKKLLLAKDIDLNQRSIKTGMTCLHRAIDHYQLLKGDSNRGSFIMQYIKVLVEAGCNVNVQDYYGRTPLHLSNAYSELEISKYLLQHGADPTITDVNGIPCGHLSSNGYIISEKNLKINSLMLYQITLPTSIVETAQRGFVFHYEGLRMEYNCGTLEDQQQLYKRIIQLRRYIPTVYNYNSKKLKRFDMFSKIIGIDNEFQKIQIYQSQNLSYQDYHPIKTYLTKDMSFKNSVVCNFQSTHKLLTSIYILHSLNIVHGNIRDDFINLQQSTYDTFISDYAIPSIINKISKDDYYTAPEVKRGGFESISTKSDIYSLGALIYEIFFNEKYTNEIKKSINLPGFQTFELELISCLNSEPEFRPTIQELYNSFIRSKQQFVEMVLKTKGNKMDKITKTVEFETELCERLIQSYGFNDINCKSHGLETTNNAYNCIKKVKEEIKNVKENYDTTHLDNLYFYVAGTEKQKGNDKFISTNTFTTINDLILYLPDKFKVASFDLLRLLLIYPQNVNFILTKEERIINEMLERMKSREKLDKFFLVQICSCLSHIVRTDIGSNYFRHPSRYCNLIDFIVYCLRFNDDGVVFAASSALYNFRYDIYHIEDIDSPIIDDKLQMIHMQHGSPQRERLFDCLVSSKTLLDAIIYSLESRLQKAQTNTQQVLKDTIKLLCTAMISIMKLDHGAKDYLISKSFNILPYSEYIGDRKLERAIELMLMSWEDIEDYIVQLRKEQESETRKFLNNLTQGLLQ
ncbi:hypothetical protein ABK040_010039 [Willaertia magna]